MHSQIQIPPLFKLYFNLEKNIMKKSNRFKQLYFALASLLLASLACSQVSGSPTEQPAGATSVAAESAEPTEPPAPTQAPMPELGEVILDEQFTDNANNWYVGTDADTISVVEGGKFKISVLNLDTNFTFDPPVAVSEADITVDTEFTEGAPENYGYGVTCHDKDVDNRYRIRISPDGTYAINKTVNTESTDIIPWTNTAAINRGVGAVNRMRVICSENQIILYVNDILLSNVVDTDLSSGSFSLLVAAYKVNENDSTPPSVSFSNLIVRKPLAWVRPAETLLADAFDNNDNGWDVFDENGNNASIENGQMIMKVKDKDSSYRIWPQLALTNVDLTFDAAVQEGTLSNLSYGAACRISDKSNYSFKIDGDGYYSLGKIVDGNWETLVDWTASSAVKSGTGEINHIRVVCSGSTLELYANDQMLISSQDSSLTGSGFALQTGLGAADELPVSVAFDNVEVKYPEK